MSCSGFFSGADESVEGDVKVAEDRQEKGVMNADAVGEKALEFGNDCTTDDSGYQQAGTVSGQRTEAFDRQRENGREHHGVEQAHSDDGPHGDVAEGEHGNGDQDGGQNSGYAQDISGPNFLLQRGTNEATHHGAAPVERNKPGGDAFGHVADIRLTEIIHQKASDGNFRADINENADGSENQRGMPPDGIMRNRITLLHRSDTR